MNASNNHAMKTVGLETSNRKQEVTGRKDIFVWV